MKEVPISNCEKEFVLQCIKERRRLDGRNLDDFRPIKINFGIEWGSVHVSLGETRVLAQVSCELGQPKATRPNEGLLYINADLSPMAAVHFEAGRNSELTVQLNRTLERTFKDSRCVDLESLCVTAEDKVWILRVDVIVLNHEGNLIDCASVAVLSALAHFKHPDVTVSGEEFKVHTAAEKDPIPIVLHHFPICVSYATFQDGEVAVADPTVLEEKSSGSSMIFGINSYRELCCLNLGGSSHTSTDLLLKTSHQAAVRAKVVVDLVKSILQEDSEARSEGKSVGFTECLRLQKITSLAEDRLFLKLPFFEFGKAYAIPKDIKEESESEDEAGDVDVKKVDYDTAVLNPNPEKMKWVAGGESDSSSFSGDYSDERNLEDDLEEAGELINRPFTDKSISKGEAPSSTAQDDSTTDSESEEEETVELR